MAKRLPPVCDYIREEREQRMGALAQMAETKGHCRLSEQIVRGGIPGGIDVQAPLASAMHNNEPERPT